MCVATVFAVGVLVGMLAWVVCWRMFPILYCFQLPSVCGDCVCSWGSSVTGSSVILCFGGCFYYYIVFCCLVCVWRLCVYWRFLCDWWPGLCVGRCF